MLPDVVLEQDKDDSNMDSLDLLMMLGYIAEKLYYDFFIKKNNYFNF